MADNTLPDEDRRHERAGGEVPWIDLDRAGIYGTQAAGSATGAAMFTIRISSRSGISESGNHDNRVYEDDWAEKWTGLLETKADGSSQLRQPGERELREEPERQAAAGARHAWTTTCRPTTRCSWWTRW